MHITLCPSVTYKHSKNDLSTYIQIIKYIHNLKIPIQFDNKLYFITSNLKIINILCTQIKIMSILIKLKLAEIEEKFPQFTLKLLKYRQD
jgi:ABC-type dipeptide/oligopeptide/nickel transport system ATPase subunit